MKKLFKVLGIIAGILAALTVIAAVALPIIFPPEKIKTLIEKQAAEQLHRQVKLGKISLGLWSGLGVDDFALSEAPDFSKGTFIVSKKFVVKPRLLPLLAKKVFIKDVELIGPEVTVVRYPDGKTYNFSSLTNSSAEPAPAKKTDASTVAAF